MTPLLFSIALRGIVAEGPPKARPNIVFIFSDDHASRAIGAYGSVVNKTPNLDKLADDGMVFDRCTVTNSICAPSRAVILTGLHSHLNRVTDNTVAFNGSQTTFPKLLRQSGYQTALIGKWHLKSEPTGFDDWDILVGQGEYYNPRIQSASGTVRLKGYTTELLTDMAKNWLSDRRDRSKPFMLMLQHKAPHRNWQPAPKYLHLFDGVTFPEPPDLHTDWSNLAGGARESEMSIARHLTPASDLKLGSLTFGMDDEQASVFSAAYASRRAESLLQLAGRANTSRNYQWYMRDYLSCVQSVDDSVGEVRRELQRLGLDKNTVVVYASDQGFYLGEKGWYDKRWMYEPSFTTPLIVSWPGHVKAGTRSKRLVQNLDFAETFLDMAGVQAPPAMQGESMLPILEGKAGAPWRDAVYYHYYEYPVDHKVPPHVGVSTSRYKLVHYYTRKEWELFDLQSDPTETKNLVDDPRYSWLLVQMLAKLEREMAKAGDRLGA